MLKIDLFHIHSKFHIPFTISGGRTKTHQEALVVSISNGIIKGWGESPAISYYQTNVPDMIAKIEKFKPVIEKFTITDPFRFWHFLHHLFPQDPFIVNALDMAGWDYYGKLKQEPLYLLFKTNWDTIPLNNYTISIDTPLAMQEQMISQHLAPLYKIKIGFENDLNTLAQLRQFTTKLFKIDCNGGWTLDKLKQSLKTLENLNIQLIEQPLPVNEDHGLAALKVDSKIPFIADESCKNIGDIEHCAAKYHGINIKLTKCGGITAALEIIKKAKSLNLSVMLGSMNETIIGTAACCHLLPQVDFADLDGPLLLDDVNQPLIFDRQNPFLFKKPIFAGLGLPNDFKL